ncbi:MAG: TRAP transporter large permease subunit [Thermodesulfovibrionales bacterium]|nr:TRAP transporter large permease subunit [Thermodesulfovibrionales bacterium]
MSPETLSILMFVGLLIAVVWGHPLAFTLGGLAVFFGIIGWGPGSLFMIANKTYGLMTNYVLVAIPLFILMAQLLDKTGIAEEMFESMYVVLGKIKGGLAISTIVVATVFAATTGIVGASVVAMGLLAGPSMLKKGYKKELVAGVITSGGTLGILIPPSIMLVVYAGIIGESVGRLFLGAIIPGLLLSALYIVYTAILCKLRPEYGPPISEEINYTSIQKIVMVIKSMLPPMILIFAVLGTIGFGIATPTEAAGMGCAGAFLLAFLRKRIDLKSLYNAGLATLRVTCMVMVLFVGANAFTSVFMGLGGGDVFTDFIMGISENKWVVLIIMNIILIILGMFVDWLGILLLCVPIFTPIAVDHFGFDPIWLAVLFSVNLQISFLSPPFGYALFYLRGINLPGVTTENIYRGIVPFICLQMLGVALCIVFPKVITWLPSVILD